MQRDHENRIVRCFGAESEEETRSLAEVGRALYLALGEDDNGEDDVPDGLPQVTDDEEKDELVAEATLHECEPLERDHGREEADRCRSHANDEDCSILRSREAVEWSRRSRPQVAQGVDNSMLR